MTKRLTGAEIKELRIRAGLSQGQLADGIMSVSYLSLIESGRRVPRGTAIDQLTERLNELGQVTTSGAYRLLEAETAIRLALRLGHLDAAKAELKRLQDGFASSLSYPPTVNMLEALVSLHFGDVEEAARLSLLAMEQMPFDHPQRASAVLAHARACLRIGIFDRAISETADEIERLTASGHVHDRIVELHEALALLQEAKGDLQAAHAAAQLSSAEAASASPQGRAAMLWAERQQALAADNLQLAADLADTAAALLRAIDQPVVAARLRLSAARMALQLGEEVSSVLASLDTAEHLLDISAHRQERAELAAFRAVLLTRQGESVAAEFEAALAAIDNRSIVAAGLRVDFADAYLSRKQDALATAQLEAAETLLQRADSEPGAERIWHRLGLGFEQVGRLEQAFKAMKLATARLGAAASLAERVDAS